MRQSRWNVRSCVPGLALVALLVAPTAPGIAAETAAAKKSSCVACHTDQKTLQAESAGIPQPAGSAMQSGKG